MAIIGFFMLPELGHLHGPLKLAKSLKDRGHQVYFLGLPQYGDTVQAERLEYISVFDSFEENQPALTRFINATLRLIVEEEPLTRDVELILDRTVHEVFPIWEQAAARRELHHLITIFKTIRFDLLLSDYGLSFVTYITSKLGTPSALLNTALIEYPHLEGVAVDYPNRLRLPVIYLCPREFELPYVEPKWPLNYYAGPSVDLHRKQAAFSWDAIDPSKPILMFALGSRERVARKADHVTQTVMEALAARPDWLLLYSRGGHGRAPELGRLSDNVLRFDWIPQLEALKRVSVMITHGGLNSVKECILMGVPMLVAPIDTDQHLNAARVAYHGLGLSVNSQSVSARQLVNSLEKILSDRSFKLRVEAMGKRFREIEESGIGVQIVETLIQELKPTPA